jgi:hypothetical protein
VRVREGQDACRQSIKQGWAVHDPPILLDSASLRLIFL